MRADGTIVEMPDEEEARRQRLVPIPPNRLARLKAATVAERVAWYNAQAVNLYGSKAERNAAKRIRRERRGK